MAAPSSSDWIVGTWELPVATQLVLRDQDGSIRRLARDSVRRVQVSEGRGSSTGQGALLGLAVGTAAGVLVQLGSCAGSGEGTLCIAHGYVLFGATGAALGSAVGAIIGALTKRELWRDVEPASLR